jgi:hypothetical protein
MKIVLCAGVLAVISAVTAPFAAAQSKQSQEGTILRVRKEAVTTPPARTGAEANRTPLQSHYYSYDVSVQLNCDIYFGRYDSESDDLPDALSPNNHVPIRIAKRVMYLDFPGEPVKMQIVRHKVSHADACGQAVLGKQ